MLSVCNELSGTRWLRAGAPSLLLSLRVGSLGSSPHSHLSYPPHVRPNTKSILAPATTPASDPGSEGKHLSCVHVPSVHCPRSSWWRVLRTWGWANRFKRRPEHLSGDVTSPGHLLMDTTASRSHTRTDTHTHSHTHTRTDLESPFRGYQVAMTLLQDKTGNPTTEPARWGES